MADAEELPRTIDGRYRLQARLGAGGMGVVYRATHLALGREVAVKLVRGALADEAALGERLEREAKAVAAIASPHVVQVLDFGRAEDGAPYLVMELLQGEPLSSLLERRPTLPEGEAVAIARAVADGLQAAHRAGIVHRDLKPENVFLARRPDGVVVPKVVDFGVARADGIAARPLTREGHVVGSAEALAPEQIRGERADARADVYALGVLLFRLLAGRPPFDGGSFDATARAHVTAPIPSLLAAAPGVSEGVAALVTACLAKDPAHRPAEMSVVLARLPGGEGALPSAPTTSRPISEAKATVQGRRSPAPPPEVIAAPRATRSPRLGRWLAAAAVGLAGGLVAFTLLREEPAAAPLEPPDAGAAQPPPPGRMVREPSGPRPPGQERPAPAAAPVTIRCATPGAIVSAGGVRLGPAPVVLRPTQLGPLQVRVEAPGFVVWDESVSPGLEPRTLDVTLRRR